MNNRKTSSTVASQTKSPTLVKVSGESSPFLGFVPYCQGRSQIKSVLAILEQCLDESGALVDSEQGHIEKRMAKYKLSYPGLHALCKIDWLKEPRNCHHVFLTLQNQGYGGDLCDLWRTVYGQSPPQYVLRLRVGRVNWRGMKKRNLNSGRSRNDSNAALESQDFRGKHQFRRVLYVVSRIRGAQFSVFGLSDEEIDAQFQRMGLNAQRLRMWCQRDWKKVPVCCARVHSILVSIGYCGSVEDLWQSVCGPDSPCLLPRTEIPARKIGVGNHKKKGPLAAILIRTRWRGRF